MVAWTPTAIDGAPDGSTKMHDWLHILKPAAPARVHLLLAALMWTVVGAALMFFGVRWTLAGQVAHVLLLVVVAVSVGLLKSRFVLDRVARRVVQRIKKRGDNRCIGGFLSLRTWAFMVLMMGCGRLLRGGILSRPVMGFVYTSVGTALLLSARSFWWAWQHHPKDSPP